MPSLEIVPILEEQLDLVRIMDWYESLVRLDEGVGGLYKVFSGRIHDIVEPFIFNEDPDLEKLSELERITSDFHAKRPYQEGLYRESHVNVPELITLYDGIVAFVDSEEDVEYGNGTGFFVSPNTLVTANHVVARYRKKPDDGKGIFTKDGKYISLSGTKITRPNRRLDLAIIEFENDVHDSFLELSEDKPFLQPAIAAGYSGEIPLNEGVMSSFGASYMDKKFCTCPSIGGLSGSPIFSLDGKVIGMVITARPRISASFNIGPFEHTYTINIAHNYTGVVASYRISKVMGKS